MWELWLWHACAVNNDAVSLWIGQEQMLLLGRQSVIKLTRKTASLQAATHDGPGAMRHIKMTLHQPLSYA
jgi:hypothetical protein